MPFPELCVIISDKICLEEMSKAQKMRAYGGKRRDEKVFVSGIIGHADRRKRVSGGGSKKSVADL